VSIPSPFLQHYCEDCGAEYFLSPMALSMDTGKCVACDRDIWKLEQLYKLEDRRAQEADELC